MAVLVRNRVVVAATREELQARKAREAELAERQRQAVRVMDPTPTRLGVRLDPLIVRTPALDLIDEQMCEVRDAIETMLTRRRVFAELVATGVPIDEATALTAERVPPAGETRLLLSAPPQEGKTTAVSRYGVLWLLRQFPQLRAVIVSYDGGNAGRISYQSRGDIELFDGTGGNPDLGLRLARDQKAMSRWRLTTGGEVYAIGIGGGLTGRPVDFLLIDDPVKDDAAASSDLRSSQAWLWWMGTGRPRLAPGAPVIVVGTRWHESDLIGRLLSKQGEDEAAGLEHYDRWRVVNIPAQADHDPAKGETDLLGREPGEFMASARGRDRDEWLATKAATVARLWSALYQGRPAPQTGTVWLREWWRRYAEPMWSEQPDGSFRVPGADRLIVSWDMAFKDHDDSDYVCGQVLARKGAETFVIYAVWARLDFPATQDAVKRVHGLFPTAATTLVEDAANGPAIIASLKKVVPGLTAVKVAGKGKVARAEAVSPYLRAGNVHLPTSTAALAHPKLTWDPDALIFEATAFPFGAHDDQVDALSQGLNELYLGIGGEVTVSRPPGRVPGTRSPGPGGLDPNLRRLSSARRRLGG